MKAMESKFDLNERLISFACQIIDISESLPTTFAGKHLGGQLVRSGTAPALHYGEAQGAESRRDFIHKMKTALKELRETFNCLRILNHKKRGSDTIIESALNENNQLISIFVKSIETVRNNLDKE